ncbi:hypothetical protein L218DRAFT_947868 [Marasmius fiardii PR-910]|nr:hypothetical protein L218DRAFT_947868 [Marasmius fiardii PR-910]
MPRSTFFENTSNAAFRNTSISNVHRDIVNNHNPANQYTIHNLNYATNNYITNHITHNNHNHYSGMEPRRDREVRGGGDVKGLGWFLKRCIRRIFGQARKEKSQTNAIANEEVPSLNSSTFGS